MVERAGLLGFESDPRLAFSTPMEQRHWPRMQRPTAASDIVAAEPMLVPSVIYGLHISGEHQQKRWERTQIVNPSLSLQLHPVLDLLPEISLPPPLQVHHHHAGVEIAGLSRGEDPRENRVGPEPVREVLGEVGVAVLRGSDYPRPG